MPKRLVAFGNNALGNLDPLSTSPVINTPTDISDSVSCSSVIWASWACTVGQDDEGKYWIWGNGSLVTSEKRINQLPIPPFHRLRKIVGHDRPVGYLAQDGFVYILGEIHEISSRAWKDVEIAGSGKVFAVSVEDDKLYCFANIADFMGNTDSATRITHPLLERSLDLYALESRCFVHSGNTLLEIEATSFRPLEDLEGLAIQQICRGGRNRLGVVTEVGEAYLIDSKDKDPQLLSSEEDEVRLMGLGSDFDVFVTEDKVLVKGANAFNQLGLEGIEKTEEYVELQGIAPSSVTSILCSRWSTFLTVNSD